jgi:hypothetical protein
MAPLLGTEIRGSSWLPERSAGNARVGVFILIRHSGASMIAVREQVGCMEYRDLAVVANCAFNKVSS